MDGLREFSYTRVVYIDSPRLTILLAGATLSYDIWRNLTLAWHTTREHRVQCAAFELQEELH